VGRLEVLDTELMALVIWPASSISASSSSRVEKPTGGASLLVFSKTFRFENCP